MPTKPTKKKEPTFSAEEKKAMRDRAAEIKAEQKWAKNAGEGEKAIQEKIKAYKGKDKSIGEKLHKLIRANAPDLLPRTWYGMPAYANKDGKSVIFFRPAQTFKERYLTLGFNQEAKLDDGQIWPTSYAVTELTPDVEKKIAALVKKAVK